MDIDRVLTLLNAGGWRVTFTSNLDTVTKTRVELSHSKHGTYFGNGDNPAESLAEAMSSALWVIGGK